MIRNMQFFLLIIVIVDNGLIYEGKFIGVVIFMRLIYVILVVIYVYLVYRNWELDVDVIDEVCGKCCDIVYQLIYNNSDI